MAGKRKGTFAFDLSKPVKKGVLLKQGAFHKAFKYRFFLVYPGFLVYYEQESKWMLDLTKGETLGGRLGAIKLKGGSCNVARDAPKACKFGFIIHAPDPLNKRPTYLISATNKQERDEWIEAVRKSTPHSPQQQRKNGGSPKGLKEEPKKKEPEALPPHPTSPVRQDTAAEAATVATENERLKGVDQSISSIDESLQQPTLDVRRDTAATAALTLSSRTLKQENSNGLSSSSLEDNNHGTSIDDLLGPQANSEKESDVSDEGSQRTTSPSETNSISVESPLPEATVISDDTAHLESENVEQEVKTKSEEKEEEKEVEKKGEGEDVEEDTKPMDTNETIESQTNLSGGVEVVTTVTVECTGEAGVCEVDKESSDGQSEDVEEKTNEVKQEEAEKAESGEVSEEQKNKTDEVSPVGEEPPKEMTADTKEEKKGKEEDGLGSSSSEILIRQEERSNSFSVNVSNIDTDDYSSSSEDEVQPPPLVEPSAETKETAEEKSEEKEAPKVNGECPVITVDAVEGEEKKEEGEGEKGATNGVEEDDKKKRSGSDSSGSTEGEKLIPSRDRRRSSQPFIEKKGFLYKMGGKRKNWNLRYVVLNPGVFTYAKNPSSKILGEVKLKNLQVFFPRAGERKTSFQFTIHTESTWNKRMDWVLAAQSEREMKDWILAFKLAGQRNTPAPSPTLSEDELVESA